MFWREFSAGPARLLDITLCSSPCADRIDPPDPRIQRAGTEMLEWIRLGGSLHAAAMLSDVSESQLNARDCFRADQLRMK
jgi:hypothetical protein